MFPVPSHVYPELQGQEVKCRASTSGLRGSTIQPDKCSYSLLVSDLFFSPNQMNVYFMKTANILVYGYIAVYGYVLNY